jgi:uncharacterized membrane protein
MVKNKKSSSWKTVVFWFLGAVCLLIASFIAGQTRIETCPLGQSFLSLMISLFLFLLGGLFWISVAVAMKESD